MSGTWSHLLVTLSLAVTARAQAAELVHKAGDSETLETIAKSYYGASWKAVYIQAANNLTGKETLAGKRLVIPACWTAWSTLCGWIVIGS